MIKVINECENNYKYILDCDPELRKKDSVE